MFHYSIQKITKSSESSFKMYHFQHFVEEQNGMTSSGRKSSNPKGANGFDPMQALAALSFGFGGEYKTVGNDEFRLEIRENTKL